MKTFRLLQCVGLLTSLTACQTAMPRPTAAAPAPAKPELPRVVGHPWRIAGNPDMGAYSSAKAQPVDFSIWQAADSTWQLVACVRYTRYPGSTRLFFRWETKSLTDADWEEKGVFLTSEAHPGHEQGQLQAPHVIRERDRYYMFYNSAGAAFVLVSTDGKSFTQHRAHHGDLRFFEMGRDVMVFDNRSRDGLLYAYYTMVRPALYPDRSGHTVGVRTAKALEGPWGDALDVGVGTASTPGDRFNFINAESPFVIFRNGLYYRWEQLKVFASTSPTAWPVEELTTMMGDDPRALYAPEVVTHEGQFFIAGYKYKNERQGIYMARFEWTTP